MDTFTFLTAMSIVFGSLTTMVVVPFWLRHRRELSKEKIALSQADPRTATEARLLKERLENLEMLMVRLDSEMNSRLERTFGLLKLATGSELPGLSQMPTTFLNVTSALESRYQILKELGRGGMGIVFQAYDKQLKEQVAIKVLSPLLGSVP